LAEILVLILDPSGAVFLFLLVNPVALRAKLGGFTHLDSQREWIGNYKHWRQQGYPVGGGVIKRVVAVVINPCMPRRGMR
jgi:hypothetical protein